MNQFLDLSQFADAEPLKWTNDQVTFSKYLMKYLKGLLLAFLQSFPSGPYRLSSHERKDEERGLGEEGMKGGRSECDHAGVSATRAVALNLPAAAAATL